ncbi:MAG: hypothetical protein AAF564_00760 [Bacteroidota bacterium]
MLRSCLTIIVLVVLAGVVYNLYRTSQEPEVPVLEGEFSPQFKKAVLNSLEDYVQDTPEIDRLVLDGSILDIHYRNRVGKNQYRLDASIIAENFSKTKLQLLNNGNVLVRCIYDSLIQVEATAENGRVTNINEL